ncbi:hypothetical protein Dsin_026390 [Dipteronia sinensis]|uniref:Large ribosomal subunit protein uL30-like ferredoxin-like fold domain-containing protein n=1 Tax=Dipteronia sinensis TaxID=43782 RepID=A0AAD9ZXG3_9ROSI|nr:hypothetical protein Dsin_026390 [Dipteronia sinensis]
MHPKTRKILYNLRLKRMFSGVFVKVNEGLIQMLQKVEPYVTYGNWGNMALYA